MHFFWTLNCIKMNFEIRIDRVHNQLTQHVSRSLRTCFVYFLCTRRHGEQFFLKHCFRVVYFRCTRGHGRLQNATQSEGSEGAGSGEEKCDETSTLQTHKGADLIMGVVFNRSQRHGKTEMKVFSS